MAGIFHSWNLVSQALAQMLGGTLLYGTLAMVILVFVVHYLAIGWQGANEAARACDRDLVDVGRLEGARGWRLFRHYAWPQMARPLAITWYATYLLALWEVETLVLILPPGGDTLPLRIFQLLHYGHNAQVNAMCLILLALALAPLLIWKAGVFVADVGRGG
jgi:iron(III) transport system permease protein